VVCGFLCYDVVAQTWEFYSGEWWPVSPASNPGNLTEFTMGYDAAIGSVLLFGGFDLTSFYSDTWEFHQGDWLELSPAASPSPRAAAAAAVDAGPYAPVLFGGEATGNPYPDTWVYEYAPGVSLSGPAKTESGAAATFTLTPDRGSAPYKAFVSFGDGSSASLIGAGPFTISHTYAAAGSYAVSANLTDSVGANASVAPPLTVTVSGGPSVVAAALPATNDLGHLVHLTATASGGTGPYYYAWNFGDNATGIGPNATPSYAAAGAYTATVVATDYSGGVANASVIVHVNPLPAVTGIRSGSGAAAGSPEPFSATVIGGTAPYTYSWRFGDGSGSASATPSHTYAQAGEYTVEVWANDSFGASAHDTVTVQVASAPGPKGSSGSSGFMAPIWFWAALVVLVAVALALAYFAMRKRSA
jgi:PKD repeat protein